MQTMNATSDDLRAAMPQPNDSPSRFLRVLRAFAVKVQTRIHREAAKSAKIPRRKILSCQQRIFCAFSWECGELETLSPALRDAPRDDLRVLRVSAVRDRKSTRLNSSH